jgi:hypothetical protein
MKKFYNFKIKALFICVAVAVCNILPTCASYKSEISRSFAMIVDKGGPHEVHNEISEGKTHDAHNRQTPERD